MSKLSTELKELFSSSFRLRKALSAVLAPEAIDYICELVAKDRAHEKFLELTEVQDQVDC